MRTLEADNALKVDVANHPDYDYTVSIRNVRDIGYNPNKKETRNKTALQMLKTQCPNGFVVGETVIDTGQYLLGNASKTYIVQVKCRAG